MNATPVSNEAFYIPPSATTSPPFRNTQRLRAGMLCEYFVWTLDDPPRVGRRERLRLLGRDSWGTWIVRLLASGLTGSGWKDWELHPVAQNAK